MTQGTERSSKSSLNSGFKDLLPFSSFGYCFEYLYPTGEDEGFLFFVNIQRFDHRR